MSAKNTVLIQGAVSEIGFEITDKLCASLKSKNVSVRAGYAVEKTEMLEKVKKCGCECTQLDLERTEQFNEALKDVKTLVILPPYKENRVELLKRFIDKACDLGVQHIVLISVIGAQSGATKFHNDMKMVETYLQQKSNISWSVLHCSAFYEDLFFQTKWIKEGSLLLPIGNNNMASVSVVDVANLICKIIIDPSMAKNKALDISGPESLSGHEMSKVLSEKLGRQINFVGVSLDEFKKKIKELGTVKPDYKLESLTELYGWYGSGNGGRVFKDLNTVLGKEGTTFTEFIDINKNRLIM